MGSEAAALAAIGFLGALVFGITGFGSALVTIPLATHLVPLEFALALFALMDLGSAFSVGLENPRNAVRAEWHRLVPMIVVGTALGVTLLVNLPRPAGMLLLGVFILYQLYRLYYRVTLGLALLTIFDAVVVWLTWREYQAKRERARGSSL